MIQETIYNTASSFRTLNYLGSKLRLLDFIEEHVNRVTPLGAGVCDLFAGSGCVSYKLSQHFPVTACDIQHYSKVICKALLQPSTFKKETAMAFMAEIRKTENTLLKDAFAPLIDMENDALSNHDLNLLTDIVEHGSLKVFNLEKTESLVSSAQIQVNNNLKKAGLTCKDSLISCYYGGVFFSYLQCISMLPFG